MNNRIIWKDCLDSTNDEVKRLIDELDSQSVVAAWQQTSGRGQSNHKWHSERGKNLTFTILFRPDSLEASSIASINHAVCTGITAYLSRKGIKGRIKWPNDIWVADRKICGLLIENTLERSYVRDSIIGIGFNLNQTDWPDDLPNPVSLRELCGRYFNPQQELEVLKNEICRRLDMIDSPDGRISLQEEFEKYAFKLPKGA